MKNSEQAQSMQRELKHKQKSFNEKFLSKISW